MIIGHREPTQSCRLPLTFSKYLRSKTPDCTWQELTLTLFYNFYGQSNSNRRNEGESRPLAQPWKCRYTNSTSTLPRSPNKPQCKEPQIPSRYQDPQSAAGMHHVHVK